MFAASGHYRAFTAGHPTSFDECLELAPTDPDGSHLLSPLCLARAVITNCCCSPSGLVRVLSATAQSLQVINAPLASTASSAPPPDNIATALRPTNHRPEPTSFQGRGPAPPSWPRPADFPLDPQRPLRTIFDLLASLSADLALPVSLCSGVGNRSRGSHGRAP